MAIADQLEALVRAEFSDLKPAEVKVVRAATTTRQAQCGPQADVADPSNNPEYSEAGDPATGVAAWGIDREVRADVIRWLCTQEEAKKRIDPRGIQLLGARVTGELDLLHATVSFPVSMVHCRVGPLFLNDCQIPRLDLDGSCTGSIEADGADIKQSVYLRRVQVSGNFTQPCSDRRHCYMRRGQDPGRRRHRHLGGWNEGRRRRHAPDWKHAISV